MQKRSANRDLAIQQGQKTYKSKPCKKCGSEEKYVSSYGCVSCNIEKNSHKLFDDELMNKYRTPAVVNSKTYRYRTRKKNQMPANADTKLILKFYEESERLTKETGVKYSVDHIIPISKGGLHHQDNLQVITLSENSKKGNKLCQQSS
jgi:5-methylcytosine-specific restriction endonuclease McrA